MTEFSGRSARVRIFDAQGRALRTLDAARMGHVLGPLDRREPGSARDRAALQPRPGGLATHTGGTPNPDWLEWLMGWPLGWTDLEDSETPSSHKSLNTSGDESLNH